MNDLATTTVKMPTETVITMPLEDGGEVKIIAPNPIAVTDLIAALDRAVILLLKGAGRKKV